jgi:phage-related protein
MYVIELSLRLSPMPVAVQRKELDGARSLYAQVRQALESGQPKLLELSCEKDEHKSITLLSSEVVAVQMYEKSAVGGGGKRPGFSVDS